MNLKLSGRGKRFRLAHDVVEVWKREIRDRHIDHVIFSGDATAFGFRSESEKAAFNLGVTDSSLPNGTAVPGNHDLYTRASVQGKWFEKAFASWQDGLRVDPAFTYPFARKVGSIWLIALNSATPNRLPFDASGAVGMPQLERFRALCSQLDHGIRVVVTHYPILHHDRSAEPRWHQLRDWQRVRDVAGECSIRLWLHGHNHKWYLLTAGSDLPFHSICVGSATQLGLWGYHEYEIEGNRLTLLRRVYDPSHKAFVDQERLVLLL